MDSALDRLRSSVWHVLRTEIEAWDDDESGMLRGYDGMTRFWCQEAVFDIYWVAELSGGNLLIMPTEDMILTGFRRPLPNGRSREMLQALASHLDWQSAARAAVMAVERQQFDLFEDE